MAEKLVDFYENMTYSASDGGSDVYFVWSEGGLVAFASTREMAKDMADNYDTDTSIEGRNLRRS